MVPHALLTFALTATTSSEVDKRVARVVNGLLPQTAFRNRWGAPARIAERMARYHTPGVSIAVVNAETRLGPDRIERVHVKVRLGARSLSGGEERGTSRISP